MDKLEFLPVDQEANETVIELIISNVSHPGMVYTIFHYTDVECEEKLWWVFLLSCAAFPTTLLSAILLFRGVRKLWRWKRPSDYHAVPTAIPTITVSDMDDASEVGSNGIVRSGLDPMLDDDFRTADTKIYWSEEVRRAASEIVSAQTLTGKIAVIVTFIVSMVSLALYFLEVTNSHVVMVHEKCANWSVRLDWQLELLCSVYLLVDFFIRFLATNHKIKFMFELYSMVDYLTIPPAFLVVVLNHHWTGLRFLRALYVLSVPDILQYFRILEKSTNIRLAQLISYLAGVVLVGAGCFHMIETHGDQFNPPVKRSYWEFIYFVVVSMSTVGYGDIYPTTRLGRFFGIGFILFAFTIFAACVPEVFRLSQSRKRHGAAYQPGRGIRHVVVAGTTMSKETLDWFIRIFYYNEPPSKSDIHVVFVSRTDPDLEMEGVLKRHASRVFYIQGSVLNPADLEKAMIHSALACLILTEKNAKNPTAEDAASVMSVISVKNACPNIRCLVQILQSRSRNHVRNIPGFSVANGDSVICFSTLELGLLAQSCLAPGFATMISNLMSSEDRHVKHDKPIVEDYLRGLRMKVVMEHLSDYFVGQTFAETSRFCFLKLNILLIGVLEPNPNKPSGNIRLNPSININKYHAGIFIASSVTEVSKAWYVCQNCHVETKNFQNVGFCGCNARRASPALVAARDPAQRFRSFSSMHTHHNNNVSHLPTGWEKNIIRLMQQNPSSVSLHRIGSDHSDPPQLLNRHLTSICEADDDDMGEGIVMPKSPGSDDSSHDEGHGDNFLDATKAFYSCASRTFKSVLLNRSKAARRQFHDHIVVLVLAGTTDPPIGFQDFILPLRSNKIRYDSLKEVVLLGDSEFLEREWAKVKNLPKITLVRGDPLDRADLRAVSIKTCAMCVILPSRSSGSDDPILDDKDAILATLNITAMSFERLEARSRSASIVHASAMKRLALEGFEVPTISALYQDANVPLLEAYDVQRSSHTDILLMEPYMCGNALPLSALDSILIANFFNPYAVELIKTLLFGDMSSLTETFLEEGLGLMSGDLAFAEEGRSGNCQLRLVSLFESPLRNRVPGGSSYGTLFGEAIHHDVMCLGIARKMYSDTTGSKSTKRCVITNPPHDYELRTDDLIYVLSS